MFVEKLKDICNTKYLIRNSQTADKMISSISEMYNEKEFPKDLIDQMETPNYTVDDYIDGINSITSDKLSKNIKNKIERINDLLIELNKYLIDSTISNGCYKMFRAN